MDTNQFEEFSVEELFKELLTDESWESDPEIREGVSSYMFYVVCGYV